LSIVEKTSINSIKHFQPNQPFTSSLFSLQVAGEFLWRNDLADPQDLERLLEPPPGFQRGQASWEEVMMFGNCIQQSYPFDHDEDIMI